MVTLGATGAATVKVTVLSVEVEAALGVLGAATAAAAAAGMVAITVPAPVMPLTATV